MYLKSIIFPAIVAVCGFSPLTRAETLDQLDLTIFQTGIPNIKATVSATEVDPDHLQVSYHSSLTPASVGTQHEYIVLTEVGSAAISDVIDITVSSSANSAGLLSTIIQADLYSDTSAGFAAAVAMSNLAKVQSIGSYIGPLPEAGWPGEITARWNPNQTYAGYDPVTNQAVSFISPEDFMLAFNSTDATPVPLPAASAGGLALLALAGVRRWMKRQA